MSAVCLCCRNDAGLAGAELAIAVEAHTLATGAEDTVGTTGIFEVSPNAVNSVPREARLAIGRSPPATELTGLQLCRVTACLDQLANFRASHYGTGQCRQLSCIKDTRNQLHASTVAFVCTVALAASNGAVVGCCCRCLPVGADVRDIDGVRRDGVVASILDSAAAIAKRRKVRLETQMINQDPPATCDDRIQAAVAAAAKDLGLSTKKMVSRAYHDSLFMARIAPTGMIFIPCKGGYSHRPDEFASEKDIGNGVRVLALAMAQLSEGTWGDGKDEL